MWAIIKFNKNNLSSLKKEFKKKLGEDLKVYAPKLSVERFIKNKLTKKEFNLLGDYIFFFHKEFKNQNVINTLKFTKGLKCFLGGFAQSQDQIETFIKRCKDCENKEGYLTQNFFEIQRNLNYKFTSGPFAEMIFKIIDLQKNKINILLGNIKTTIKKEEFLFTPL